MVYNADVDIARTPGGEPRLCRGELARFYEAISSVDADGERGSNCWTRARQRPCPARSVPSGVPHRDYYTAIDTDLDDTAPCAPGPLSTRNRKRNSTSTPHRKSPST
ncbi:MAG: hypothetical protein ACLTSX_09055 [Collinsella sp.]